jgi:hypothetical protein
MWIKYTFSERKRTACLFVKLRSQKQSQSPQLYNNTDLVTSRANESLLFLVAKAIQTRKTIHTSNYKFDTKFFFIKFLKLETSTIFAINPESSITEKLGKKRVKRIGRTIL